MFNDQVLKTLRIKDVREESRETRIWSLRIQKTRSRKNIICTEVLVYVDANESLFFMLISPFNQECEERPIGLA
jgi:hypothetical protein